MYRRTGFSSDEDAARDFLENLPPVPDDSQAPGKLSTHPPAPPVVKVTYPVGREGRDDEPEYPPPLHVPDITEPKPDDEFYTDDEVKQLNRRAAKIISFFLLPLIVLAVCVLWNLLHPSFPKLLSFLSKIDFGKTAFFILIVPLYSALFATALPLLLLLPYMLFSLIDHIFHIRLSDVLDSAMDWYTKNGMIYGGVLIFLVSLAIALRTSYFFKDPPHIAAPKSTIEAELPSSTPTATPNFTPKESSSGNSSGSGSGGGHTTDEIVGPLSRTVYWTSGGKSYHFDPNCSHLARSNSVSSGTLAEARAAGKKDPCDDCVSRG